MKKHDPNGFGKPANFGASLSFVWRSNPTGFGLEDWRKKCSMFVGHDF